MTEWPGTVTMAWFQSKTIFIPSSRTKSSISPNVRALLALISGKTSSGTWITCKSCSCFFCSLLICLINDARFIGSLEHYSQSGLMWTLALDGKISDYLRCIKPDLHSQGSGQPELPGSNSCAGGCRGVATVNSDGSYRFVWSYIFSHFNHGLNACISSA